MELPISVNLQRPITVGEQTYEQLLIDEPDLDANIAYMELAETFPEPKMVKNEKGDLEPVYPPIIQAKVTRFWLARTAGVSEAVVGKIKGSDLEAVNAAVEAVLDFASGEDTGTEDGGGNEAAAK